MSAVLEALYRRLAVDARVLDVGCFGFRQVALAHRLGLDGLQHAGVDFNAYSDVPAEFEFRRADLSREPLPFEDDAFDLVVASHVIEHLPRGGEFIGECLRVCRPGGAVYVEAPSERALLLPGMPFDHEKFYSLSFFDDPTHVGRPWSPQSLYRLARYYGCEPEAAGYLISRRARLLFPFTLLWSLIARRPELLQQSCWSALGWASQAVIRKPASMRGMPTFQYYIPARA
jgi:SAM-dependent methyltransferase